MAYTLNEYLKLAKKNGDAISATFLSDLQRHSVLMDLLSFKPISGLEAYGQRWQTLPSAAFRNVNAGYTSSEGKTEQIKETLSLLGGDITLDNVFSHVTNVIEDPVTNQIAMKAEAVGRVFNDYLINGDQAVDPLGFEGIKKRISNMPSRMTINIDDNDAGTGDVLNVLASGNVAAHKFINALHKAKKYVGSSRSNESGGDVKILCNETTFLGIGQVARQLNLYQEITDALGRTWDTIAGMPFIDVGYKSDLSTEIITNTEDPGDGGTDSTSLYVVRFGGSGGLTGIQLKGMSPMSYDPLNGGEKEATPQKIRRIDWAVGLYNASQYCMARVKGFAMIT